MSSLTLDYTHCLASTIGATHGLTDNEIETLVAKFPKHHENIEELRASGESAFFDLPYQDTKDVKVLIKENKGKWESLVVVGMGGASVTAESMVTALGHEHWNLLTAKARKNAPRVFFLDNLDAKAVEDLEEVLDPKKTLFLVISKTGNTAETNALYLHLVAWLKKKSTKTNLPKQVIVATDPEKSPLALATRADKFKVLPVPGNLGDRFALLGPQNLLLAGLCGFDVDGLIEGTATMDERCRHDKALENPAYMHSLIHYLLTRKRRKTIHAMMAFSNRAYGVVEWYAHLLSVSLGKMLNRKGKAVHVGPGPAYCVGPSGCYGQMQLYQEGPFDKVTTFVTVEDHGADLSIPSAHGKIEGLAYLGGHKFSELVDYGYYTAAQVITAAGRPNMTVVLDDISERSIASLYFMLELSSVMSAELYGIDAFNQPGVDENKQGVFAQLHRAGFEDKTATLEEFRGTERKTC